MSGASRERKIDIEGGGEGRDEAVESNANEPAPENPATEEAAPEDMNVNTPEEADAAEPIFDDSEEDPAMQEIDLDALILERDELAAERDELRDQLLRTRAEFDNYRKRVARDNEQLRKTAAANVIRDLLPILDNLELALNHVVDPKDSLAQGVQVVVRQFLETLQRAGLEPIPAAGEPFDPNIHEAVMQEASEETPADTVLKEFQRGYKLGDQVLRPSKVVVSSGSDNS